MTYIDPASIVRDLQQFQPTFLGDNLERCGARVDRIFDELLQGVHWGDNDLPGCDLVDNVLVQRTDAAGRGKGLFGCPFRASWLVWVAGACA